MYRPYESAVHRPCTPHSVPLTLQVIVSDVYRQIEPSNQNVNSLECPSFSTFSCVLLS